MTIARAEVWIASSTEGLSWRRAVLWALVAAKIVAGWGLQWDIQWHIRIGRDSFWIPPHMLMYAGVTAIALLSFGTLARDTWRRRGRPAGEGEMAVMGCVSTPGFHLAAWGVALTVLAAPIDDLWHRLFGIDVTLWSPPHLLGFFGSFINSAGCLLIAQEVYPRGSRARQAALIVSAALLLLGLTVVMQQAFSVAYVHGGLAFHLYAILGTLVFSLPYLLASRLSGLRAAPVLVFVVALVIGLTGGAIARQGFEILQPVPISADEIAKDPASPIAVARAIMPKTDGPSTARAFLLTQLAAVVPILVIVAVDPRRRLLSAAVGYGVALLATMAWGLSRSPAFAPLTPGIAVTVIALLLTTLSALAAALVVHRLSHALTSDT